MRCPKCSHEDDKVVDSRSARNGAVIRRRRMCLACDYRFTTYEEVVRAKLMVVKRDGRREDFDREKLLNGIARACEKRSISAEAMESVVDAVIDRLENEFEREVEGRMIGAEVMARLQKLDHVAYVRYASVYRRFEDVSDFVHEVEGLRDRQ